MSLEEGPTREGRLLVLRPGSARELPAAALEDLIDDLRRPEGETVWVHGEATADLVAALGALGLHEVAAKSLQGGPERPRVEEYADHLYVSLFSVGPMSSESVPSLEELRVFLGPRWIISLGYMSEADLAGVAEIVTRQVMARSRGPSYVLYFLAEWVVQTLHPVLDDLNERIDRLEDLVVVSGGDDARQELFRLKRDLVDLRRRVAPVRDVLQRLSTHGVAFVEAGAEVFFRDVHDDVLLVIEQLDTYRDILSSALDLHLSTVSNRLNQVMKALTVVATLFMPITFITGFFGQNFLQLPFGSALMFWFMIVLVVGSPLAMLVVFHRRGWL